MRPFMCVYYGYSARDVCRRLSEYPLGGVRRGHAIDALVAAVMYGRLDTFCVLVSLGTPLDEAGPWYGVSVFDAQCSAGRLGRETAAYL